MNETQRQQRGLVTKYTVDDIRKKSSRLLLVEDSAVNREILLDTLSKLGFTADVAVDGRAAIEAAQRESYGLILMDLNLPDMTGIEAIEAIRALPGEHARASVMVLTAGAPDSDKQRCRALGVQDFLIKPVDTHLLADALTRWQTSYVPLLISADRNDSAKTAPKVDAKLIGIFTKEADQRLESLRQALATENAKCAAREAHSLKSSSAYFQAHAMHKAATQLEQMADSNRLDEAKPVLHALEKAYSELRADLEKRGS